MTIKEIFKNKVLFYLNQSIVDIEFEVKINNKNVKERDFISISTENDLNLILKHFDDNLNYIKNIDIIFPENDTGWCFGLEISISLKSILFDKNCVKHPQDRDNKIKHFIKKLFNKKQIH